MTNIEDMRPRLSEAIIPLNEIQHRPTKEYAKNDSIITAELLEKLCKENPEILTAPKNKACFWYDAAIRGIKDIFLSVDKRQHPEFDEFWLKKKEKVYVLFQTDLRQVRANKLDGENSAQIITEELNLYSLKSLVNFIDGGAAAVADGDGNPRGPWGIASQIFAKNASGIAFVISGQRNPTDKCIWASTELPALMKNDKIDMIVELDSINPNIIKSIRFVNGLNLHSLQCCNITIPVNISGELTKLFSSAEYISLHDIYQKTNCEHIQIKPCIIKYSADGKRSYSFLDSCGRENKEHINFEEIPHMPKQSTLISLPIVSEKMADNEVLNNKNK